MDPDRSIEPKSATSRASSSDIVAKAIQDLNEELAQLGRKMESDPETRAFIENGHRYESARRAAFEAAAPIARELDAFGERNREGFPADSPKALEFEALRRAKQRAIETTFKQHGFRFPKDELPGEAMGTAAEDAVANNGESTRLSTGVTLERPLPAASIEFLEFLYDRGFNPILPEELPSRFASPDVRLHCDFQGLISTAMDGIQISRKGRAFVAEGRARKAEQARRPTEHAGLPRTPEVKRVIDGVLQMQHACTLIEWDRINYYGGRESSGVSPAFAASMGDKHYAELRAALERTRSDLPGAAWALGATADDPVGDYRLTCEALNLFETQLNTAIPLRPLRAAPDKWLSLGKSLNPVRFRLQTMALRTSTPPGGDRVAQEEPSAPVEVGPSMETTAPAASPKEAALGPCFIRDGERWRIRFNGTEGSFDDGQPMRVLRKILAEPHPQVALTAAYILEEAEPTLISDPQMDDDYRKQAKARACDLVSSIREARQAGDTEEVNRLTHELQQIEAASKQASGLGGRDRQTGPDPALSQVKRVARALKEARRRLRDADPAMTCLDDHCDRFIARNSNRWSYRPAPPVPQWEF